MDVLLRVIPAWLPVCTWDVGAGRQAGRVSERQPPPAALTVAGSGGRRAAAAHLQAPRSPCSLSVAARGRCRLLEPRPGPRAGNPPLDTARDSALLTALPHACLAFRPCGNAPQPHHPMLATGEGRAV